MKIPLIVQSCNITDQGNAEGIVVFNELEFNYLILPPAGEREKYDITIKDIDVANLKNAGFHLDLQALIDAFSSAMEFNKDNKEHAKNQKREKHYILSPLHQLKTVLGDNFSMMPEEEYIKSKSLALFAIYRETYKDHTKELTIFMDRENFIVYDNLNRKSVAEPAKTPGHVKEIIEEELGKWKHKVDFKLLLIEHADSDSTGAHVDPIRASEYFQKLQIEEKIHEKEILANHLKYLKELGKLGANSEIKADEAFHLLNTDTNTIEKKKILGSMPEEDLKKMQHPFSANDL